MFLHGKHILLGITGSIAAYKSAFLVRQLRQAGAEVRVLMTASACQFITPLTLQGLSAHPVETELFAPADNDGMRHIELARWADLLLIAPASANLIGKMTHGVSDDVISTVYLAHSALTAIVPAMNRSMWEHPATAANIKTLTDRNVLIWGPATGEQACGDEGAGRMLEPQDIIHRVSALFGEHQLAGCKTVITAGPTCENIDAVRYLSNFSSGKMGFALAQAACELGADTTLISGPVTLATPRSVKRIDVVTAEQMRVEVHKQISNCQLFIACAAVADYRPTAPESGKIKKLQTKLHLELTRTVDILDEVSQLPKRPFIVGFAAETDAVLMHAKQKLLSKNIDMIVANQVGPNTPYGFNSDSNAVTVLWHGGNQSLGPESKTTLGKKLLNLIADRYQAQQTPANESIHPA